MGSRKGRRGAGGLVRARGHLRSSREEGAGVSGAGEKLGRTSCFPSAKSSQTPQNALRHREWARASCVTTPGTPKEKVGACLDAHTHTQTCASKENPCCDKNDKPGDAFATRFYHRQVADVPNI